MPIEAVFDLVIARFLSAIVRMVAPEISAKLTMPSATTLSANVKPIILFFNFRLFETKRFIGKQTVIMRKKTILVKSTLRSGIMIGLIKETIPKIKTLTTALPTTLPKAMWLCSVLRFFTVIKISGRLVPNDKIKNPTIMGAIFQAEERLEYRAHNRRV